MIRWTKKNSSLFDVGCSGKSKFGAFFMYSRRFIVLNFTWFTCESCPYHPSIYSVGLGRLGSNYWVSLESANSSSWTMTIFLGIFGDLVHWRHYTKTLKNQQLCQKPTIKIFDTLSDTILTYMQIVNWPKTCAKLKSSLSTMFLQTRNNTKKNSFSKSTPLQHYQKKCYRS